MKIKKINLISFLLLLALLIPNQSYAFIKISDLVFDGMSVNPDELEETLETIKTNKKKNKKNQLLGKKKRFPVKLQIIEAFQAKPQEIQLEIDTSEVVAKTEKDIQGPISNTNFFNAISEAVALWESVDIADINFLPLKFASGQPNPEDGRNIITFRAIEEPEGAPDGTPVFSIITYARSNRVEFMGKLQKVKPGTILDADIIFDPTNNPCLALHTTEGDFMIGGDNVSIADGGVDPAADLSNCDSISGGDITDLAVRSIANVLGLESSAIASAASAPVAQIMTRYALTNDDRIGLANIYPNKEALANFGSISGKVVLNKKPVTGAHIVLEDTLTGEPVTGTITDIKGKFDIKFVPAGTYNLYVEPLDGPTRSAGLPLNFFGFNADLNFTTAVLPDPVTIASNKKTRLKNIEVTELSSSAFNINAQTALFTESDVNQSSGLFLLPITIMPGETLTGVRFWGSNISPDFGSLSVTGNGITISNVVENKNVPISPFMTSSTDPDEIPGIEADITAAADATPGPRNIIFTGDVLDPENPSFGLRDQITGGLIVTEE